MEVVKFILLLLFGFTLADEGTSTPCTSYRNIPGNCIDVRSCPKILQIMTKTSRSAAELKILQNIGCDRTNPGYVCCEFNEEGIKKLNDKWNLKTCGTFNDDKIRSGKEVQIHSRPWMALLKFRTPKHLVWGCGGTLITKRFVLTAAHCFSDTSRKLIEVRLGEHNTTTNNSCQTQYKCERGHIDIKVDLTIIHNDFDHSNGQNDIALVKLVQDVIYQVHIRPICLPLSQELREKAQTQDIFQVAGWGITEKKTYSDVLMQTTLYRIDCDYVIAKKKINSKIEICTDGTNEEACRLDSGGPLMYPLVYYGSQRIVQFGIISHGTGNCELHSTGFSANILAFLSWISEKIME